LGDPSDELEETYLNGFADEVGGDVETTYGHLYRVGNVIVRTNTQGFKYAYEFENVACASAALENVVTWEENGSETIPDY
jgi:hypothetical protein